MLYNDRKDAPKEFKAQIPKLQEQSSAQDEHVQELAACCGSCKLILANIKEIVFQTDRAGKWIYLNPAWTEVTGFSVDTCLGVSLFEFIHPDDIEGSLKRFEALANKKREYYQYEVRYRQSDGSYCWIEMYARSVWNIEGTIQGICGTLTDVTDRRALESELNRHRRHLKDLVKERTQRLEQVNMLLQAEVEERRQTQEELQQYKLLAENTADIMLFISLEGKIVDANKAAVTSYGYTKDELIKIFAWELRETQDLALIRSQFKKAMEGGCRLETVHCRKDGSVFPVEVNLHGASIGGRDIIVSVVRDVSERKRLEQQLHRLARYDHLTGIANRFRFDEYFSAMTGQTIAQGALLFVDIDNFKVINDTYGHLSGDRLLVSIARCLQETVREDGFLARLGGDEFAVYLPKSDEAEANLLARRIRDAISLLEAEVKEGKRCKVTTSIGVALNMDDHQKLLSNADIALHRSKEEGKNRITMISTDVERDRYFENSRILSLIMEAMRSDRIILHYQPVFKENAIIHYEALMRILDVDGSIISPGTFIPIAERYGLMAQLDRWVFGTVLQTLETYADIHIFLNLSGVSLSDDALLQFIETSIIESDIAPNRLGFEITETAAITDLEKASCWIGRLRGIGCLFALDDFGVGFSSFSHLGRLPVDYLKIDGSFIRNLHLDDKQKALVSAMNTVAHALGKKTIAEFVENETILQTLAELGVDCAQGYYLGRPEALEDLLAGKEA